MKKPRKTPTAQDTSIVDGQLFFEDCRQCSIDDEIAPEIIGDGYTKTIRVISLSRDWYRTVYIDANVTHREDVSVEMTLRREIRSNRGHWYAYRRVLGTLHKRYVGTDEKVNSARLIEVASAMPSR